MAAGDAEQPPNEILAPGNFLTFTGAALKLFKPVGGRITLAFSALIGLLFALAVGGAFLTSSTESDAADAIFQIAQLLALPLLGSLLMARLGRVMVGGLVGRNESIRSAGRALTHVRSHLFASAMLAGFLTFAITIAMGPLGNFLGAHLLMGPPILIHVIALEGLSFTDGWARTKEIARGEALRTFLYLLCLALALVLLEQVVAASSYTALRSFTGSDTASLINLPIFGVVMGVGMSLMTAFALQAYLQLRARDDENFDIDDLAAELDEGETEEDDLDEDEE